MNFIAEVTLCSDLMLVMLETQVQSLGWENILEKEMATHSSNLAWRIPWNVVGMLFSLPILPVSSSTKGVLEVTRIIF